MMDSSDRRSDRDTSGGDESTQLSTVFTLLDGVDTVTWLIRAAQFTVGLVSLLYLRDIRQQSTNADAGSDADTGSEADVNADADTDTSANANADADGGETTGDSAPARPETLESIVGTTPKTHTRLNLMGIETVDGLAAADPVALAEQTGLSIAQTTQWVTDARVNRRIIDSDARFDAVETPASADPADPTRPSSQVGDERPAVDEGGTEGTGDSWNPGSRDTDRPQSEQMPTESDGGHQSSDLRTDMEWREQRDSAAEREGKGLGRFAKVFESEWQVTTGTFVIVWAIAIGLYGAGDVVTTWYALATGFSTETNPIMSAAISIHPAVMIVVKVAILAGLYSASHTLVTDNELSLDDQIALSIPVTLSVVGTYATLVNMQNLPSSMIVYVVLSIVLVGISGAAAVALYEGIPLTADGVQEYDFDQTLRTNGSDGGSRSSRPTGPVAETRTERRSAPGGEESPRRRDTNTNDPQSSDPRSRERTDPPTRAGRREPGDSGR